MINNRFSSLGFLVVAAATVLVVGCGGGRKQTTGAGGAGAPSDCNSADCGPTSDDFFNNNKVAELRLTIRDEVLAKSIADATAAGKPGPFDTWLDVLWAWWQHCQPPDYYWLPVQMEYRSADGIGNATLQNVGMRLRGTKSRGTNVLQGFKLDVQALLPEPDAGESKRKFAHLSKLNELSIEGDTSLMLQCAAYKLANEFDVPAPRCNHMQVYINDVFYGIMQNIEPVDTNLFLDRVFDDNDGSLYAASAGCGYDDSKADLQYISDSFADYQVPKKYEPLQTFTAKDGDGGQITGGPETDLIPMLKCGDVDSTPDDATFKACIQEWVDVPEWLRLVALESLMPTLESFLGALRNYYLYFEPDKKAPHGGRFALYSWDYDTALVTQSCYPTSCDPFSSVTTWFGPAGTRAKLITRLTKVFRAEYCETMSKFLNDVYKPEVVAQMARVLEPVVNHAAESPTQYWPVKHKEICPADAAAPDGAAITDGGACTYREEVTPELWQGAVTRIEDFIVSFGGRMKTSVAALCAPATPDSGQPADGGVDDGGSPPPPDAASDAP
jgi:spore coat protein CotH